MLVLTRTLRRPHDPVSYDKITLYTSDGPVEITLCDIRNGKVRLGFAAPDRVKILRNDLPADQHAAARQSFESGPSAA